MTETRAATTVGTMASSSHLLQTAELDIKDDGRSQM